MFLNFCYLQHPLTVSSLTRAPDGTWNFRPYTVHAGDRDRVLGFEHKATGLARV